MSVDHPRPGDRSAQLLQRWQEARDHEALDELLQIEISILKRRLRARGPHVGADAGVSDVAQEAVMRMLQVEAPPQFDNPQALRGYLWTAASRLLLARLQRPGSDHVSLNATQSSRLELALSTTGGLGRVEERDRGAVLGLALQLLEPDERAILDLTYFQALGIEGAARALGVSHDAANSRLVRARRSLAKKLVRWTEIIG